MVNRKVLRNQQFKPRIESSEQTLKELLELRGKIDPNYPPNYPITTLRIIKSAGQYFDDVEIQKRRCVDGIPIVGIKPYRDGCKTAIEGIMRKLYSTSRITDAEGQHIVAVLKRRFDYFAPSSSIVQASDDDQMMDASADVEPTNDVGDESEIDVTN